MTMICIYLMIGAVLARRHVLDVAVDAQTHGKLGAAFKWAATWPMWVGR